MSIPTGGPKGSDEDEVGGSMGIVGALEQVGGYEGVSACIGGGQMKINTEIKTGLRRWGG